jgi:hypothetical protein
MFRYATPARPPTGLVCPLAIHEVDNPLLMVDNISLKVDNQHDAGCKFLEQG